MTSLGWIASSYYARTRNSAWIAVAMLFLACAVMTASAAPAFDAEKSLDSRKSEDRVRALDAVRQGRARVPEAKLRAGHKAEKDPLVRLRFLQALSAGAGDGARGELIAALRSDPVASARQAAAQELGKYASAAEATTALAEALAKDAAPEVRYACALSLGLSQSRPALRALEKAAADPDPNLRRQAAASLRRMNDSAARAALRRLARDRDASVRAMAGAK